MKTPVLCFVQEPWAFFTTQQVLDQWGDGWSIDPYECNAGHPYEWCRPPEGVEPWEIVKLAWEGPFTTPDHGWHNSPYSVHAINRGLIPWLVSDKGNSGSYIKAGATIEEFRIAIESCGGVIYERTTNSESEK